MARFGNEGFKGRRYRKNTTSEFKAVFEMTAAGHDTSGKKKLGLHAMVQMNE